MRKGGPHIVYVSGTALSIAKIYSQVKSSQRRSTDADWSQPLCPYHNKRITYYFNIISC